MICPCGSGNAYAACCGPLHDGVAAASAQDLMRSRYCAYLLALESYLLATWHPRTRPVALDLGDAARVKWLGLEIRRHAENADSASVEFVARSKQDGRAQRLHEISRFLRENGRWFYLDGEFPG